MGLRMKNFNIFVIHWNVWLSGGLQKTKIEGGLPKKGAWTVCQYKGAWQERGVGVFDGGLIP